MVSNTIRLCCLGWDTLLAMNYWDVTNVTEVQIRKGLKKVTRLTRTAQEFNPTEICDDLRRELLIDEK